MVPLDTDGPLGRQPSRGIETEGETEFKSGFPPTDRAACAGELQEPFPPLPVSTAKGLTLVSCPIDHPYLERREGRTTNQVELQVPVAGERKKRDAAPAAQIR